VRSRTNQGPNARRIERVDLLERPEKGLLHQVVRVLRMAHETRRHGARLAQVGAHQAVERLGVALLHPENELALCGIGSGRHAER
jgi:hypothetical protein